MAEKRMFTKKVTDDDNFMSLSSSAQALYLHLSMAADDDGFCNQVNLSMFKAHASVQDLEALLAKRYVYQFENGVIVIKHWRMANALRKDRYTPTAFQEELAQLQIKPNGSYTMTDQGVVANWLPDGCQVVAERLPQESIDKNRLDKNSVDENRVSLRAGAREPFQAYAENEKDVQLMIAFTNWLDAMATTGRPLDSREQGAILTKLREEFPREEWVAAITRSAEKKWRSVFRRTEDRKAAQQEKQRAAWSELPPQEETDRLIRLTKQMEEGGADE